MIDAPDARPPILLIPVLGHLGGKLRLGELAFCSNSRPNGLSIHHAIRAATILSRQHEAPLVAAVYVLNHYVMGDARCDHP